MCWRSSSRLGEVLQYTTGGALIWRKADNWTGFTDGSRTWVLGPRGLQQRLSRQRFRWEATPGDWTLTRARLGTVTGRVLARPCTPVESVTNPCPGRPVADARVDFSPATGGQTVVVTPNRAGAYTARLWAGTSAVPHRDGRLGNRFRPALSHCVWCDDNEDSFVHPCRQGQL